MNTIEQNTAHEIWTCHREIRVANELLKEISERLERREEPDLRDAFGRHVSGLELAVPNGDNTKRLFRVPWNLATSVIRAHIAEQKRKLAEICEVARLELEGRVLPGKTETPSL